MYLTVPVKLFNFTFFDAKHSINKVIQIFKFILVEVTNDAAPLRVGNMLLCLRVDVRLG